MPPISISSGVVKNTMLVGNRRMRLDQRAFFQHEIVDPELFERDGRRQSRRTGANDDDVANGHLLDDNGVRYDRRAQGSYEPDLPSMRSPRDAQCTDLES